MPLDLTSTLAKLTRAQEHAQTVKNEAMSWMDRSPYFIVQKANADSTRYSLILRVNEAPSVQRWSLMIADSIGNLRAALDHLVYTIAVCEAAPNPPADENKLAFPITDCWADFDEAIRRGRLGSISDRMRAAIESFQPYNRPHDKLPPLLSILRDLNNRDKHKLLQLVTGRLATGDVGFIGDHPRDGRTATPVAHTGEIKDGTEIFAIIFDRPTPNMKYDRINFLAVVSVRHNKRDPAGADWTGYTDFSALLSLLFDETRRIIFTVAGNVK